jgi:hypothetical protein
MTPGSFSSPTLKSKPIARDSMPTMTTVNPVKIQNGTLTSILLQAGPAQSVRAPDSDLVPMHWQTKHGVLPSSEPSALAYLLTQLPRPEQSAVEFLQACLLAKHAAMALTSIVPAKDSEAGLVGSGELSVSVMTASAACRAAIGLADQVLALDLRVDSGMSTMVVSISPEEANWTS